MDWLDRMGRLIADLKKHQQEGEQPLDTVSRILGAQPDIKKALEEIKADEPVAEKSEPPAELKPTLEKIASPIAEKPSTPPTPPTQETQEFTGYRFKNMQDMDVAMTPLYGSGWQAHVSAIPLSGLVPETPEAQAELERVYNLGAQGVGSIMVGDKLCTFTQLMIEKG